MNTVVAAAPASAIKPPLIRLATVSYTHLDVYKRQIHRRIYKFVYLKEKEADGTKEYCLYYKVLDADFGSVVIIDEASMEMCIRDSFCNLCYGPIGRGKGEFQRCPRK